MFSSITRSLRMLEQYLLLAGQERQYYRNAIQKSRDACIKRFSIPSSEVYSPPLFGTSHKPLSGPSVAHYSFDFAQQVHYPSDPWQPGPMYFRTPWCFGLIKQKYRKTIVGCLDDIKYLMWRVLVGLHE